MLKESFVPISVIDDDRLLVLQSSNICIYHYESEELEKIVRIPLSFKNKLALSMKLTRRLLRLINIIGVALNDNDYIIVFKSQVYKLSIKDRYLSFLYVLDKGTRPLSLLKISDSSFCDSGVYYGDYCSNIDKNEINIYKIDENFNKCIVYTFANGEVNHVHSMVFDKENECVWIFTGDFGNGSAIWMAKKKFTEVLPVLRGEQVYRSCVASTYQGGLIYLTDTPFERNSLRRLVFDHDRWISKKVYEINGSVIYGMEVAGNLYFASTVESNGTYKNRLDACFSRKRGDGIVNEYSYLYCYNKITGKLSVKYIQKKDIFPFVLFQFGTFTFPSGTWNRGIIPIFQIATRYNDLKTVFIEVNHE